MKDQTVDAGALIMLEPDMAKVVWDRVTRCVPRPAEGGQVGILGSFVSLVGEDILAMGGGLDVLRLLVSFLLFVCGRLQRLGQRMLLKN